MANLPVDPSAPRPTRASQLRYPGQAQEDALGITAGRDMMYQRLAGGVASGSTAAPGSAQVADVGAQTAGQTANKAVTAGVTAGQQMLGDARLGQQAQQQDQQATQQDAQLSLQKTAADNANRLSKLSASTQQNLVNKQKEFQTEQIGQGVLNETQLMDWSIENAKSQDELQDKMQTIQLAGQRKLEMLQVAYKKITQQLQDAEQGRIQNMSNQSRIDLAQAAAYYKQQIAKTQAANASKQSAIAAAGMVGGAVVGTVIAPGVGTAAGAAVGSGLGQVVGSTVQ